MTKITSIILGLGIIILFAACDNTSTKKDSDKDSTENTDKVEAENFDKFYTNFVSDDVFQTSRVNFPIKGGDISEDGTIEWTKENWFTLNNIDEVDRNEFDVFIDKSDNKVTHEIQLPRSGFSMNYTFEIIDGKWYITECNIYNY